VSTATVSERVKRLTEKGIICGYTALLNTSEMGLVTLITKIKIKPGYSVEEVGKEIAKLEEWGAPLKVDTKLRNKKK